MSALQIVLYFAAGLHVGFMAGEMFPWSFPYVLGRLSAEKLRPKGAELKSDQAPFVVSIVKNAGIYNGIVAASLFAVAYTGEREVARVLLTGVTVAGIFGAVTLSRLAAVQALVGLVGLAVFYL